MNYNYFEEYKIFYLQINSFVVLLERDGLPVLSSPYFLTLRFSVLESVA